MFTKKDYFTDLDRLTKAIKKALTKLAVAKKAEDKAKAEAKTQETANQVRSVATEDDGYAASVSVYKSKDQAERVAENRGGAYLIEDTQMENEPIGQVEEHDHSAHYRYVR